MKHNLFTHPTEVTVTFDEKGEFKFSNLVEAENTLEVLSDMNYDKDFLNEQLERQLKNSSLINTQEKENLLGKLNLYLEEHSYLKTVIASRKERLSN